MNYFDSFLASRILCYFNILDVNPLSLNESSDTERLLILEEASLLKLSLFLVAFSFKLLLKPVLEI